MEPLWSLVNKALSFWNQTNIFFEISKPLDKFTDNLPLGSSSPAPGRHTSHWSGSESSANSDAGHDARLLVNCIVNLSLFADVHHTAGSLVASRFKNSAEFGRGSFVDWRRHIEA